MGMQRIAKLIPSGFDERAVADALAEGGILWLAGRAVLFVALLVGWMTLL